MCRNNNNGGSLTQSVKINGLYYEDKEQIQRKGKCLIYFYRGTPWFGLTNGKDTKGLCFSVLNFFSSFVHTFHINESVLVLRVKNLILVNNRGEVYRITSFVNKKLTRHLNSILFVFIENSP